MIEHVHVGPAERVAKLVRRWGKLRGDAALQREIEAEISDAMVQAAAATRAAERQLGSSHRTPQPAPPLGPRTRRGLLCLSITPDPPVDRPMVDGAPEPRGYAGPHAPADQHHEKRSVPVSHAAGRGDAKEDRLSPAPADPEE